MSLTLHDHILAYIQRYLKIEGAWLLWCDPRGDWLPLLRSVNKAAGDLAFELIPIDEHTANAFGSPLARKRLQERIKAGAGFVLHVKTEREHLGWLSAHGLLAEEIQDRSLRQKLREWGWQPQNALTTDNDLASLARQNLHVALTEWGGGKLSPDKDSLLEVLAGGELPGDAERQDGDAETEVQDDGKQQDQRVVLDLTVDEAGLPPIDAPNLERWRLEALARLLVTQAHQATQQSAPHFLANHEYLIPAEKRTFALDLLARWQDSMRLSKGLRQRILDADRILGLGSAFQDVELSNTTYLSQAAERALFATVCTRLAALDGRDLLEEMVPLRPLFERHVQGFWGGNARSDAFDAPPDQRLPWSELARLSVAVKMLLDAAPKNPWGKPADAVAWYCRQGWQVERAGEELMRQLSKPTPELLNFITPLRDAYAHHWENYLARWSDLWLQAECPLPDYASQGTWLKQQLKEPRASAVIVIDALRYDIGMALMERVNQREGGERASVTPARTALPSITALGMGMALPIDESELRAEVVNGKWQLYQQGQSLNLSIAENRRAWLRAQLNVPADHLLSMGKDGTADIPQAASAQDRLFIFDDTLDKLGHDEELEPFGTQEVQARYLRTIEQLRDRGWKHILVVTDHGFIHWPGNGEKRVHPPAYDPVYSSRRALAYPAHVQLKGPRGLAPGGQLRVALTHGAECFRAYGGLGYFHGGASLQEWIVPCLKIAWPNDSQPVNLRMQELSKILSLRSKVVVSVVRKDLFANENALAREVKIEVREQRTQQLIFESQPVVITPNDDPVSIPIEPREGVEAARNTPMTIELRDTNGNTVIATQTTTLMVDIENW